MRFDEGTSGQKEAENDHRSRTRHDRAEWGRIPSSLATNDRHDEAGNYVQSYSNDEDGNAIRLCGGLQDLPAPKQVDYTQC